MGVAKVILNNETLMDVTQKTVTSSNLLSGFTALGADGEAVVGGYVPADNVFVVEVAYNISTQLWEPNKTITEIRTAYAAGKHITVEVDPEQYDHPVTTDGWYNDYTGDFLYYVASQDASTCYYNCYALSNNGVTVMEDTTFIIPQGTLSILSNGSYDVGSYASASINVQPALQSKTVHPSTSQIIVTPDGGYTRALDDVTDSVSISGGNFIGYTFSGPSQEATYARISGTVSVREGPDHSLLIFTLTNVICEFNSSGYSVAAYNDNPLKSGVVISGATNGFNADQVRSLAISKNSNIEGQYSIDITFGDRMVGPSMMLTDVTVDFSDDVNFGAGFDGLSSVTVYAVPVYDGTVV